MVESFIRKEIGEPNNFMTEIMGATTVAMNAAQIEIIRFFNSESKDLYPNSKSTSRS